MISAAAVTAAARAAQQLYITTTTPTPSKVQAPPLCEVSHFTLQSSPAESTLTPAHTQHPQAATHLPVNIFGNDEEVGQDQVLPHVLAVPDLFPVTQNFIDNNNKEYENAIANELDDILEFNANHGEKMSGNFVINPNDDDFVFEDLDEDGREDHVGDSNEEGDEADVHNIALARRLPVMMSVRRSSPSQMPRELYCPTVVPVCFWETIQKLAMTLANPQVVQMRS
jgi:hypothetical protein